MAPPEIGSEVTFLKNGRITRYNDDNTVNIKMDDRPGRPLKVHFSKIKGDCEPAPATPPPLPIATLQPLPPLDPLPPLEEKKGKGGLFWTGVLTVVGGIAVGVSHALGHRILDAVWPYIQQVFPHAL